MKKVILLLLILTVVLSGCEDIDTPIDYNPILKQEETCENEECNDYVIDTGFLNVVDLSEDITYDKAFLDVYYINNNNAIPYVDLYEYLSFCNIILQDYELHYEGDIITISYDIYGMNFYIKFNKETNVIYINDTEYFYAISDYGEHYHDSKVTYYDGGSENFISDFTIDLDDYDIEIVNDHNQVLFPLQIADMFFSGEAGSFYNMSDKLYFYNDEEGLKTITESFVETDIAFSDIKDYNTNFIALYMDIFYGLKETQGVDSFQEALNDYELDQQTDFTSYHQTLERFVADMDDLHTHFISFGYHDQDYIMDEILTEDDKLYSFLETYNQLSCSLREEELAVHNYYQYTVLEVNNFTENTSDLLDQLYIDNDTLILDLSCNTGGLLEASIELLYLFTPQSRVYVNLDNDFTKEIIDIEATRRQTEKLDVSLYVLTSNVTYSAGNFVASYIKDYDLGVLLGQDTYGGGHAIQYMAMPDGSVLVSSSHTTILDRNRQSIEDGIKVDYELDYPITKEYFDSLFDGYGFVLEPDVERINHDISLLFDTTLIPEEISDGYFRVYIKNQLDNTLVHINETDSLMEYSLDSNNVYRFEVYYVYEVFGLETEHYLYTSIYDDVINGINDDFDYDTLEEFSVNQEITPRFYGKSDYDMYRLVIEESGHYEIISDSEYTSNHFIVYDQSKNEVVQSNSFYLEAGVYYIRVSAYHRTDRDTFTLSKTN